MRRNLVIAALALAAAGCGGGGGTELGAPRAAAPSLLERLVRSPDAKTDMDTNPANLASAVVTYSLGQLPKYIDDAGFRLLPFDLEQAAVPGKTLVTTYRLTVPRTRLVLDEAVVASPTSAETKDLARDLRIRVSLDGRYLPHPDRYWVFYRNNGPQICRIYFPGDLGSLQMGAHSTVWHPLSPGRHVLRVEVTRQIVPELPPARTVRVYRLRVLRRPPNAAERALAPDEDGPPPANNRTPLTFRSSSA